MAGTTVERTALTTVERTATQMACHSVDPMVAPMVVTTATQTALTTVDQMATQTAWRRVRLTQ
eukprot:scaffold18066_cov42-Cyclotella_meneghiniana.AAC.11